MTAKFHDKLAQSALESALAKHNGLATNQCELQASRDTLLSEIKNLENELEALAAQPRQHADALSVAEIDAAVNSQESRRTELETARDAAARRLRLTDDARTKVSSKIADQRESVRTARAALAASYERWTLNQSAIKEAMTILAASRAVWDASVAGCLDVDSWCRDLLWDCQPTQKQNDAASVLLKIPNG